MGPFSYYEGKLFIVCMYLEWKEYTLAILTIYPDMRVGVRG